MIQTIRFAAFFVIAGLVTPATQLTARQPAQAPASEASRQASALEEWSATAHTIQVRGQAIPYHAHAGTTLLTTDAGEPTGLLYSVAYVRSDVKDRSTRPISFVFNGGPGSASMWLHMGAFGPRRVSTVNGEFTPPAPYSLVDNTETLLDKTDLVFIDAMGTGYSRATGKGKEADFFGVDEDAGAFAQFIVTYLSRNGRWNSPKFLIGESYGTFRAAVLGNLLQQRYNVHLNGISLISSVLDLSTITFADGDDRVYQYYLPSYAAVAYYFKVLKSPPASLEVLLEDARKYATTEYAAALFKGDNLTAAEKDAVAAKLSTLTGLSADYLLKANLRVKLGQFNAELMRSRGLTAGRIDARFTGATFNLLTENAESDPFFPAVGGAYTALLNHYNHEELGFGRDKTYRNTRLGSGWNWTRAGGSANFFPSAPNVQRDLAQALITNPKLLVQVENGYYDMATPFFPTEYTFTHLAVPESVRRRITMKYYPSGHMMYLQDADRVALHKNVSDFIDRAVK
jgi:carboxypeptidase C (cathepsin A)